MGEEAAKEALKNFVYENAELERLEEIVDRFNIFASLNIINQEIRHSNFLSWLLDPNGSHGLGDYFLASFLKKVSFKASSLEIAGPSIFDIDSGSFDDAEVLREWRNIDIVMRSDTQRLICVVENKIYSGEHSDQLRRYQETMEKEFPDYRKLFVYLTVEGDIPSTAQFIPFSYGEVASLIENLLGSKSGKIATEILAFISHYKEMLRRYIMKDSEIQEICKRIYRQHRTALDLIFEYKPDNLLEIHDCLVDIIGKDEDLDLDDCSKSYIRFFPKSLDFIPREGKGWTKSKRILLFEFNNNPRGLILYLIIGPGPQSIRERLYEIARNNPNLFNKSNRALTAQWFTLFKKSFLRSAECEDKEIDEIKTGLQEKISKFKTSLLLEIEREITKYRDAAT